MKTHHVVLVTPETATRIRRRLEEDGFRIGKAPYSDFEAVGNDVRVTFYPKRGKLLIQGAGTEGLLARLADLLPAADEEGPEEARIAEPTIGSDEAGKGDYFGPLVVAACLVTPDDLKALAEAGIRDSKEMKAEGRLERAAAFLEKRVPHEVVEWEPERYGRLHERWKNVNRLLGIAHAEAIGRLLERAGARRVVVDRFGGERYVLDELGGRARGIEVVQVPRAEANPAVAAASVLARARYLEALGRLSEECGVDLIPGASAEVEERARKVFRVGGMDLLRKVAKVHFRTTERVVR